MFKLSWFSVITSTVGWQLFRKTGARWLDDKAPRLGAALAFYSVLSLAPLLLLVFSLGTFMWGHDQAQSKLSDQIVTILGVHAAEAIKNTLTAASHNKDAGFIATVIGLITLLFSASGMFGELQDAMNTIWKTPPRKGRPVLIMLRERAFSFIMVLGSGFLLLVSVLASTAVAAVTTYITDLGHMEIVVHVFDFLLSFGVSAFLFALAFRIIPDAVIPWRSVWAGGALTALLFVIGKTLIGLYLGQVSVTSSYGAAGSIVALLTWIYYSAQIFFFGAEFTFVYSSHFGLHKPKPV
ncbi:MAG: YihY/virulence factor BrkB family protein [Pseudomonadota bacterium]|nr:YihY/virulence factor BrkB family protein [Pseudomonadota bacterium]